MQIVSFTNDNNVEIKLINHPFSNVFITRNNHEILFRQINTYLINNSIIKNNIIDLGAWIGDNSIPWAKNIKDIIYSIDPSPENCDFIKKTCELNDINNIKIIQSAISDKNQTLITSDNINHCSFIYNIDKSNSIEVKSVCLDFLHENGNINNIGYIHLDVEGMEFLIIKGADKIINMYNPIITFEQHLDLDNYMDLSNHLITKGYNVFLINEILPGCRYDCRNFIAFPSKIDTEFIINNLNIIIHDNILTRINSKIL